MKIVLSKIHILELKLCTGSFEFLGFDYFCLEKYEISGHYIVNTLLSIVHISNSKLFVPFPR